MNKYISILRGINVSGQKKIKMADLTALYQNLGLSDVVSYIQSGNLIFNSSVDNITELKSSLEQAISQQYGFDVPVEIRTQNQFCQVLSQLPFQDIVLEQDGSKVLVTFLSAKPCEVNISELLKHVSAPERLVVSDQIVYLHCPNGYGRSKLSNVFIEKKLKLIATTRNLKTVSKLVELSSS